MEAAQAAFQDSGFSPFQVDLGFFNGPLDLLLHLVRKEEVPIEEVQIAKIAERYLQIIEAARRFDLEVAAEYLVVAATLMAIKSESLLPVSGNVDGEEMPEPGSALYEELRERLRRYEEMKERAGKLRARPQLGLDTFVRRAQIGDPITAREYSYEVRDDTQSLAVFFIKVLKRIGEFGRSLRISLAPISVIEFMVRIIDSFQENTVRTNYRRSFVEMVRSIGQNGARAGDAVLGSRGLLIGSFIALLELIKRGAIAARHDSVKDEIIIAYGEAMAEMETSDSVPEEAYLSNAASESSSPLLAAEAGSDKVVPLMPRPLRQAARRARNLATQGVTSEETEDIRREVNCD